MFITVLIIYLILIWWKIMIANYMHNRCIIFLIEQEKLNEYNNFSKSSVILYHILIVNEYRISQNCDRGKLWQIECHLPIFYPIKFISIFCKTLDFRIKIRMSVSRDWSCKLRCELRCKDVNLEIFLSPSWSRIKIWSFRLTIFIFVITLRTVSTRKLYIVDHVTFQIINHDLVYYWTWTDLVS